jgi:predicted O-linked N-acetylglucosamine transferase (SPINDLY family)
MDAAALFQQGLSHFRQGRHEAAREVLQQVLRQHPDNADTHKLLAIIAWHFGHQTEAEAHIRTTLASQPEALDALNLLALVLLAQDRFSESRAIFSKAIALAPDKADLHNNLGLLLIRSGELTEAVAAFRQALALDPAHAQACNNCAETLRNIGEEAAAAALFRQALAAAPDYIVAHSNLIMLMSANPAAWRAQLPAQWQRWERQHALPAAHHAKPAVPGGEKISVGFVSADLRTHPVSYFFAPLLAALVQDESITVTCYDTNTTGEDDSTRRMQRSGARWRRAGELDDAALAQQIERDRIDILVDLCGHTANNRLRTFTLKPAPVQATYLGYFASSGLSCMDYWLSDAVLHPAGSTEPATETIVRLPRCWVSYAPPADAPEVAPPPNAGDKVVFASFSSFAKIGPAVIAAWSAILLQVPSSSLLLMDRTLRDAQLRAQLLARFAVHGIASGRLVLRAELPMREYLQSYALVDIVLDPFPRTGGTTTAEALWMGVPVVTLAGQHYVERISASKLQALDLAELTATDIATYIQIACTLASDPRRRAELRKTLRPRLLASPLGDPVSLAQALSSAFAAMLRPQAH